MSYRPILNYLSVQFIKNKYQLDIKFQIKKLNLQEMKIEDIQIDKIDGGKKTDILSIKKVILSYSIFKLFKKKLSKFSIEHLTFNIDYFSSVQNNKKSSKEFSSTQLLDKWNEIVFAARGKISLDGITYNGKKVPLQGLINWDQDQSLMDWKFDLFKTQIKLQKFQAQEITINKLAIKGSLLFMNRKAIMDNELFHIDLSLSKDAKRRVKLILSPFSIKLDNEYLKEARILGVLSGNYNEVGIDRGEVTINLKESLLVAPHFHILASKVKSSYLKKTLPLLNISFKKGKKNLFTLSDNHKAMVLEGEMINGKRKKEQEIIYMIHHLNINLDKSSPYFSLFLKKSFLPQNLTGLISLKMTLDSHGRGTVNIAGKKISGQYQKIKIKNLNTNLTILDLKTFSLAPKNFLSIEKLTSQKALDNIHIDFSYSPRLLHIQKAHFSYAEGKIKFSPTFYDFGSKKIPLTSISIQNLPLQEVLKLAFEEGEIAATGMLGGNILLAQKERIPFIQVGHLKNTGKGHIKYHRSKKTALNSQENKSIKLLLSYLENLNYDKTDLSFSSDREYNLKMALAILGHNPQVLEGRPLKFTLNLNLNWMRFLRSTFGISNISKDIEDKLLQK